MKKLLLFVVLAAGLASPLSGQGQLVRMFQGSGAPSGGCTYPWIYTDTTNGVVYWCNTGSWLALPTNASPTLTTPTLVTPTTNGLSTLNGDLLINALATPSITSVTPQTAGGGKTCTYKIVALVTDNNHTAASAGGTTADCANDLTAASSGDVIVWGAVTGATGGYDIYRTAFTGATPAGGAATGKIAHVATGVLTYTDAGANGDAASAPSTNTTGEATVGGLTAGYNVFTATGGLLSVDTTNSYTYDSINGIIGVKELRNVGSNFAIGAYSSFAAGSGEAIGFTAGTSLNARDVAISRISPGLLGVGTGAQGSVAGSLSFTNATMAGTIGTYNNVATVGIGVPYFQGHADTAAFSTTQSNVTIATSVASDQQYDIGYSVYESTNGSGGTCNTNSTVTPAITYTDPNNQTHTFTAGAISLKPTADAGTEAGNCLAATGSGGCLITRKVKASTTISITYTYANGNCNTQPKATANSFAMVIN